MERETVGAHPVIISENPNEKVLKDTSIRNLIGSSV